MSFPKLRPTSPVERENREMAGRLCPGQGQTVTVTIPYDPNSRERGCRCPRQPEPSGGNLVGILLLIVSVGLAALWPLWLPAVVTGASAVACLLVSLPGTVREHRRCRSHNERLRRDNHIRSMEDGCGLPRTPSFWEEE